MPPLAIDNRLIGIVEHLWCGPRLVATLRRALDSPTEVWRASFRSLSVFELEQQILLTLATLPARPWRVDVIRELVAPSDALA